MERLAFPYKFGGFLSRLNFYMKKVHRCRIIQLPHFIKETSMNTITISQKQKNKHLSFQHYEFIINSLIKFNAEQLFLDELSKLGVTENTIFYKN